MGNFYDDEEELISFLKKGDKDAFYQIYSFYYNRLCRYIISLSNGSDLTEDIVQDTLFDLWKRRERLSISSSLKGYLYTSAHNFFVDNYRKENRRRTLIERLHTEAVMEAELDDDEIIKLRKETLQKLIAKLPKKRREIFILNKLENYKYREIAVMRDISERTVESQIRKALITLREEVVQLQLQNKLLSIVLTFYLLTPFLVSN